MFQNYEFKLEYKLKGANVIVGTGENTDDYSVEIERTDNTLKYVLHPKKEMELVNAYLIGAYSYKLQDRIFINGYQSWTTSREYGINDVQKGLSGLAQYNPVRMFCALFGDYYFQDYTKQKGVFHGYSYTYINTDGKVRLYGTTNERTGYTIFHHDMPGEKIIIQKDVEGKTIDSDYAIFELYAKEGNYEEVFDAYFEYLNFPKPRIEHLAGYTSWYNYYGHITEEQILRDLDGLATVGKSADIFQIDDGYQDKVGDWHENKKFPGGMKNIVDKIHAKGYLAGLWMAPFNAADNSKVAKEHPEWLIKVPGTNKRQLGVIGWGGGGTFDFYIPEAAQYIKNFFNRVVNEWGFDMVKLDFLYSVCITPRRGKTRGEIMCDAMDFLRECIGEKTLLLGCGVPLFPSFGVVDACRISCDIAKNFKSGFLSKNTNQELPSAENAINNSLFRRHLNGRVMVNDPDVFYLRKNDLSAEDPMFVKKSGKLKFTEEQKLLLAEINNMCGDVLFVSDNVGGYDDKHKELVKNYFKKSERKVIDVKYDDTEHISIEYDEFGKRYKLTFNIKTGENTRKEI